MSSFDYEYGTLSIEPSNISTHKRQTSNLYNSASKIQDFFGVDIAELKNNTPSNKRNSAPSPCKLKSIFNLSNDNKQTKKLKQESKRIRRGLNKLRKEKKQIKCNLLRKLTNTKSINNTETETIIAPKTKISWRPTLKMILNDNILLDSLIKFMEMSYNSENILFLQEIIELNNSNMNTMEINNKIIFIYNKYIIPYSEYQINLSYHCLMNIMNQKNHFITYEIEHKKTMFNLCVDEIQNLIITSVLNSFYVSTFFQLNASKSKYYKISIDNHPKYYHNNYPSNHSNSSEDEYSPYASLSAPPIKIESSISTESFFEFDA